MNFDLAYRQQLTDHYPEDRMFPTLDAAVEAGITWATPVSPDKVLDGAMRYSGHGAVHDNEQFNPERVANSVMQALGC